MMFHVAPIIAQTCGSYGAIATANTTTIAATSARRELFPPPIGDGAMAPKVFKRPAASTFRRPAAAAQPADQEASQPVLRPAAEGEASQPAVEVGGQWSSEMIDAVYISKACGAKSKRTRTTIPVSVLDFFLIKVKATTAPPCKHPPERWRTWSGSVLIWLPRFGNCRPASACSRGRSLKW